MPIQDKDLPTVKPRLEIIGTTYNGYLDVSDYPGMLRELISDPNRNKLIVEVITQESPGHYSLILSDRIEHLGILKEQLSKALPGKSIEILTGQLPNKERTGIMERAKNKDIDILLATQLAREGLDLPHLDRLFLVSPKGRRGPQQELGNHASCDNSVMQLSTIFGASAQSQSPVLERCACTESRN